MCHYEKELLNISVNLRLNKNTGYRSLVTIMKEMMYLFIR